MSKPSPSLRSPLAIIFLTVFIDLVGFGIVLPLLPTYAKSFGASGLTVGCIMAAYSAMQFLFAPAWGALSDRIGRRPVLLVSTAGASLSYLLFAFGSSMTGHAALWVILASRIFAGICGANLTVAQAYIADITPPEDSAKRMGLIGMAFGLGFIIGPMVAIGGQWMFGKTGPGWVAAGICAAAITATTVADILGQQSSSDDDEPLFDNLNARASSALHSELSPRSRAFAHKVMRCCMIGRLFS